MAGALAGEGKTDAKEAKTIAETARLRADLVTVAAADPIVVECVMTAVLTPRGCPGGIHG